MRRRVARWLRLLAWRVEVGKPDYVAMAREIIAILDTGGGYLKPGLTQARNLTDKPERVRPPDYGAQR